jgi:hypothetical protein
MIVTTPFRVMGLASTDEIVGSIQGLMTAPG